MVSQSGVKSFLLAREISLTAFPEPLAARRKPSM
jgi:hypothetical protein